jgi:hypothetical protein
MGICHLPRLRGKQKHGQTGMVAYCCSVQHDFEITKFLTPLWLAALEGHGKAKCARINP